MRCSKTWLAVVKSIVCPPLQTLQNRPHHRSPVFCHQRLADHQSRSSWLGRCGKAGQEILLAQFPDRSRVPSASTKTTVLPTLPSIRRSWTESGFSLMGICATNYFRSDTILLLIQPTASGLAETIPFDQKIHGTWVHSI